jgi:menaquinone-9 beta-reductase
VRTLSIVGTRTRSTVVDRPIGDWHSWRIERCSGFRHDCDAMLREHYDAVVIGGSVAGCVCALRLARKGLAVAIVERHGRITQYKRLCTHFIQPLALPVLKRLGLDVVLEAHGAVRTKAAFWTPEGMIDPIGDYTSDPMTAHGYNIERRVLDPLLRTVTMNEPACSLMLGHILRAIDPHRCGWRVETCDQGGESRTLTTRCLIAADGRASTVARLAGNAANSYENQRCAYFSYFAGIPAPAHNRSIFMRLDPGMGFLYPLANNRTLLAAYAPKQEARRWRGAKASRMLLQYFDVLPIGETVADASELTTGIGYSDYPNLLRSPVHAGIAFIGDAAVSLDPMSGVGCAFAIVSADLLAQHVEATFQGAASIPEALSGYAEAFARTFDSHCRGVMGDSLVGSSGAQRSSVYRQIVADEELQRAFIALTGRVTSPMEFQKRFIARTARKASTLVQRESNAGAPN